MKRAGSQDVGYAGQFGRDEACTQPELLTQLDAGRLLDQQRVGASVDGEPVHLFAEDHAAGTRVTLEHDAPDALPRELVRRRESRDSAADDYDVRHVLSS